MPFRNSARRLGLLTLATLAACAGLSGPTQVGPDTYLLVKRADDSNLAKVETLKADLAREAKAFADSRGKRLQPLSTVALEAEPGRPARVEYRFTLSDPPGTAIVRPAAAPAATPAAPQPAATAAPPAAPRPPLTSEQAAALHADLLKLEDLRQRGIVTQAEFDELKRRLLQRN